MTFQLIMELHSGTTGGLSAWQ